MASHPLGKHLLSRFKLQFLPPVQPHNSVAVSNTSVAAHTMNTFARNPDPLLFCVGNANQQYVYCSVFCVPRLHVM